MPGYTTIVEVDGQGRITIPPPVRRLLNIKKGTCLEVTFREIDVSEMSKDPLEALVITA